MLARIRKAVVAGLGAGIGAATTVLANAGWHLDSATVSQALGAFVTAAAALGWATWRVENAGSVNGSYPKPPTLSR